MTSSSSERVAVLVAGKATAHADRRLRERFDIIAFGPADPARLTQEQKDRIRGIAAFGEVRAPFIDALPGLEIIANFGVGYDSVDAAHAGHRGVMVTNTPDVLTEEVADTTIGLLLNTVREFSRAENWLREGCWVKDGPYPLTRGTLRGRRVGILGMGRIGMAIARRLEAFGLPVAYHNRRPAAGLPYRYYPTAVALAEVVDTLISVLPGGAATSKAVGREVLAALGPNGVFINIGRGTTVDDEALADALADGTILAAGLDVFVDEPNVPPAYLTLPNITLLPHVGSASVYTRDAMADLVVDNLISWFGEGRALTAVPEATHIIKKS